ncbi:hydroxyacid dehydrogenase [Microbacterium oleivorans]|uniref:Hydroxyacid dehydrogenase n=2 Tax=Microbacterium oleivorans TaxID=273677 RepID=A0A7D5J031_9MICO|nr:hydroxyacid dehydrogenase [Microbacterium oleivorans]
MSADVAAKVFPPDRLAAIDRADELRLLTPRPLDSFQGAHADAVLSEVDVLLTGWGSPVIDEAVLDRAPRLRLIAHAGGSVKGHVGLAAWERGVAVCSATDANAQPVAEFAAAMILLAGKQAFPLARIAARSAASIVSDDIYPEMGNRGKRVGIVGASRIGRRTLALLRPYDLELVVHDPYLSQDDARALGARAVSLEDLLRTSDVISLHAPALPETRHLLNRAGIALLRRGAVVVNTARGALIDHDALTERVVRGELTAILDVTDPEELPIEHPLRTADHAFLTPHIAGSMGTELPRLADSALNEACRFARGEPLVSLVWQDELARQA